MQTPLAVETPLTIAEPRGDDGRVSSVSPATAIKLSVVLPAADEEAAIGSVVREVHEALSEWPYTFEVLVVDDGSRDATDKAAAAAGARVFRRIERGGYGAAVKSGIRAARGEWIALLDADGSYDPAVLPALLARLPAYDQVNGSRPRDQGHLAFLRWIAKGFIRLLAQWISRKHIPDLNTGLKIFKRRLALDYLWTLPEGFSASTSLTLAFMCGGHMVTYVPVPYRPRIGKSKFHPLADTLNYIATVLRLILYFRPLRVFMPVAGMIFLLALPILATNLARSPTGLHDADVFLLGSAAMIAACGMLAELIVAQRRGSTVT